MSYVVNVKASSMIKRTRHELIERAWGLYEKHQDYVELDSIFKLKAGAVIETFDWLAPIIYTYDPATHALIIREVLPAAPRASYHVESIGGEKIKKYVEVGVVYVYTKPLTMIINTEAQAYTSERIPITITLNSIKISVNDVTSFLQSLWRSMGVLSAGAIIDDVIEDFRREVPRIIPNLKLDELLIQPNIVEDKVKSRLLKLLEKYNLNVLNVSTSINIDKEYFDYYFWHIVNEIPIEFSYLKTLLSHIPREIIQSTPETVRVIVEALLSKYLEKLRLEAREVEPKG